MKYIKKIIKYLWLALLVVYIVVLGNIAIDKMNQSTAGITQTLKR